LQLTVTTRRSIRSAANDSLKLTGCTEVRSCEKIVLNRERSDDARRRKD
jgi:hypothetical protein